ncbi:MAG: AmmeMemoRadiSam system radical SAM enzyme [Anaerohalosphaera sp.]|nr:AmmeMemoRadiSam system radical SAM enzyme [Anaerohalosphaera sp.]
MTLQRHLKPALFAQSIPDMKQRCDLCNFHCIIPNGQKGHCGVRQNINGTLLSLNYDRICSAAADPIEKKPLFHFQPGSHTWSIAAPGCNFRCSFCQNWNISQSQIEYGTIEGTPISPDRTVAAAVNSGCSSIAYTYTEPTVFFELCDDTARLAKQAGLKNVFVSNGYMTTRVIDYAKQWLDAINIDLKAFSQDFYRDYCSAQMTPVLNTIRHIAKYTGIWLEITTLVIPGLNDSDAELKAIAEFIADNASPDTPWHVSRYYPAYHLDAVATPAETLHRAIEIGKKAGLNYIYVGNLPHSNAESTICPNCKHLLIERAGYHIISNNIKNEACPNCKTNIPGTGM